MAALTIPSLPTTMRAAVVNDVGEFLMLSVQSDANLLSYLVSQTVSDPRRISATRSHRWS